MVNKELLLKAGLSQRETDTYLALIRLKEAKAGELAKNTGEQRSNTYDTLNTLIKKNLVTFIIKNNTKIFSPNPPEKLMDFLEQKKKDIEDLEHHFKNLVIDLNNIYSPPKEKPIIEVYEGKEGMRTVFLQSLRETLKTKKEIVAIGAHQQASKEQDPLFYKRMYAQRQRHNIKSRYIITEDITPLQNKLVTLKVLPKGYKSPTATYVYGNKVSFWHFMSPLTIIVIESKELTESYRNYFEYLWKQAKQI